MVRPLPAGQLVCQQFPACQFVAYRIVGSKPNEAIEVALGIEDRTVRACTLAGITLRLKDRGQAAGLLESAIDGIIADPHGYYNGGGGGTAAIVLYRAKQFGHPDLAGLRDKVLAARTPSFEITARVWMLSPRSSLPWPSPIRRQPARHLLANCQLLRGRTSMASLSARL